MTDFQLRVVAEANELEDKITKLCLFAAGPIFDTLPSDEKLRLAKQLGFMKSYHAVLEKRIQNFY